MELAGEEIIWAPCDQANTVDRIKTRSIEEVRSLEAAAVK
jgi:hypothetical protein